MSCALKNISSNGCNRTIYNTNSKLNARMSDGRMFTMYRPAGLADDQCFFEKTNNTNNKPVEYYIKNLQSKTPKDLTNQLKKSYPNYVKEDNCNNCRSVYTVPLRARQESTENGFKFENNTDNNASIGLGRTNNTNSFQKNYTNTDADMQCAPCDIVPLSAPWKRGHKIQPDMEYSEKTFQAPDFRFGTKITGQADVLRRLEQQRQNRSNESNVWDNQTLSARECANIPRYQTIKTRPYEGGTYASTSEHILVDNWDKDGVCRNHTRAAGNPMDIKPTMPVATKRPPVAAPVIATRDLGSFVRPTETPKQNNIVFNSSWMDPP